MSRNKIQVSCEGPDDVADLFTMAVQGIWHERVDFNKLSETGIVLQEALRQNATMGSQTLSGTSPFFA